MLHIADILYRYVGIIEFMKTNPGMYGMDEQREKAHVELCEHYRISKENSKKVTDNLDRYKADGLYDPELIHRDLEGLRAVGMRRK